MKILIFMGTMRDSTPPKPARLGARVARACAAQLASSAYDSTEVTLIDPLEIEQPIPFKPHFAYAKGGAPKTLDDLATQIAEADGYVMVSPEYNHSMSPALAHLLNHFGASLFAFKPSAIVTYSAGQWGGARAAMNMRSYLGELGCLPVSAMIHIPTAQDVFAEDGSYLPDVDASRWQGYLHRTFAQLIWWAAAAKTSRASGLPTTPFTRTPADRNAPQ